MKKIFVYLFSLSFLISSISFAYKKEEVPASEKSLTSKYESVEIIEGTPKRSFTKLQPIWASGMKMTTALKNAKKQATKMGADAIIQFSVGTNTTSSATGIANGVIGGFFGSSSEPMPVVQGWGVKWND